jgi:hypothetical protein
MQSQFDPLANPSSVLNASEISQAATCLNSTPLKAHRIGTASLKIRASPSGILVHSDMYSTRKSRKHRRTVNLLKQSWQLVGPARLFCNCSMAFALAKLGQTDHCASFRGELKARRSVVSWPKSSGWSANACTASNRFGSLHGDTSSERSL